MSEKHHDRLLRIRTAGIREWRDHKVPYHRYEPTPYKALDQLFQAYSFKENDHVVDFGCGRGRVTFYIHHRFGVPVTGIEAHELTYEEALDNKAAYRQNAQHSAPIRLKFGLAEHYDVKQTDNKFYFFNPFSVKIFKQVVYNILRSVEQHTRTVDLILYYPLPEYKRFLQSATPFRLINKIRVPGAKDQLEKFLIYRLDQEQFLEQYDDIKIIS